MNIFILFFTGLIAGLVLSQIQKTKIQGPNSDIALGMMGAIILGGFVSQFTELGHLIILMSLIGAVIFIEIGRLLPEPH